MTKLYMFGDQENVNMLSKLVLNDGTTATTKPGSDKDCMQTVYGWVDNVI